jgi:UDP-glucose 4-epimerase
MKKTILVTGGSGYIGTTVCMDLVQAGYDVINVDVVKKEIDGVTHYTTDFASNQLHGILKLIKPYAIIHLAGESLIGKDAIDPESFYVSNVQKTLQLLSWANEVGINKFIFASSAAVYGPIYTQTAENEALIPLSVYGETKKIIEKVLADYESAYGMNYVSLRLFNVAGADIRRKHGYTNPDIPHLLPRIAHNVLHGIPVPVNGNKAPTSDGTCERDFVHLLDVSRAFLKSLAFISSNRSGTFNIGSGSSKTVKNVISSFERINSTPIETIIREERIGDVHKTCACIDKAKKILSWEPTQEFKIIVESEWEWCSRKRKKK